MSSHIYMGLVAAYGGYAERTGDRPAKVVMSAGTLDLLMMTLTNHSLDADPPKQLLGVPIEIDDTATYVQFQDEHGTTHARWHP